MQEELGKAKQEACLLGQARAVAEKTTRQREAALAALGGALQQLQGLHDEDKRSLCAACGSGPAAGASAGAGG